MAHLWTKTPMYRRTTGALAQAAPQLPDNRSATLFRFSPLPSLQDTGEWEATGPPPKHPPQPLARDSCVLGGCSCDWLAPRTVYCPQWEGRSGPFLYHWPERREKVMGWREEGAIAEMLEREKETERERERASQRKQTGQRLQCVSGQRGVSECSTPLWKLLEGYLLLALSFIISQEKQGHLFGQCSRHTRTHIHRHANRCVRRTHIWMCEENENTFNRTWLTVAVCSSKIHVVDIWMSLKVTLDKVIKPMWKELYAFWAYANKVVIAGTSLC